MNTEARGSTIASATHHIAEVNGGSLHYVAAGTQGTPILLVHGFPETWWAFHKVIPSLASKHRVFAVDLRGVELSVPVHVERGSRDRALAESRPLTMPVLAVGAAGGGFTAATMKSAGATSLRTASLGGVGHYAATWKPRRKSLSSSWRS